jgi:hypothetical protein
MPSPPSPQKNEPCECQQRNDNDQRPGNYTGYCAGGEGARPRRSSTGAVARGPFRRSRVPRVAGDSIAAHAPSRITAPGGLSGGRDCCPRKAGAGAGAGSSGRGTVGERRSRQGPAE